MIAAGLTFFISIALIIGLYNSFSPKTGHNLAAFNLILELSIAVGIALRASNNSNFWNIFPNL